MSLSVPVASSFPVPRRTPWQLAGLALTTLAVVIVMWRRQFDSRSRRAFGAA